MGGSRCDLAKVNQSRVLHLLGLGLKFIPAPVFRCTCLVRLDLAYNHLPEVPASIALLTSLEHLWLQGNPIESIHAGIQNCTRLKVLDLRDTALRKIPHEIGRLPKILEIDLRGAPLKEKLRGFQRDTERLMEYLRERDARKQIKVELFNKLSMGLYREALNSSTARKNLAPLIKTVCLAFNDLHELGQVARHCNRLFPASLAGASDPKVSAVRLRERFSVLRGKIERKRLASRLELKMRAIYYDVVEPSAVEEYIASIYRQVEPLEDIQFIVRHAGAIFPTNPENITGEGIERNMLELQKEMTNQRKRCVDELFEELNHRGYSDQDSSKVLKLTQEVAGVFAGGRRFAETSELEALKQLRADSQRYFPADIQEAEPERIRTTFVAHRREQRQRQQQQ